MRIGSRRLRSSEHAFERKALNYLSEKLKEVVSTDEMRGRPITALHRKTAAGFNRPIKINMIT